MKEGSSLILTFFILFTFSATLCYSQHLLYSSELFPFQNDFGFEYFSNLKLLSVNSTVIAFGIGYYSSQQYICFQVSDDMGRTWGKIRTITPFNPSGSVVQQGFAVLLRNDVIDGQSLITVQYLDETLVQTFQAVSTDLGYTWSEGFPISYDQLGAYIVIPTSVVDSSKNNDGIYWCGYIKDFSFNTRFRVYKSVSAFKYQPVIADNINAWGTSVCEIFDGPGFLSILYHNSSDQSRLYYTSSSDQGKTWSSPVASNVLYFSGSKKYFKITS